MRSTEIEKLVGDYVIARFPDEETVRLLSIKPPTQKQLRYGYTSNRVHIRRFLTGGWIDTWVYPRDVVSATEPPAGILRIIEYVEKEVGPKP